MRTVLLALLLPALAPELIKEPPKEATKSEPKLVGTWNVVTATREGVKFSDDKVKGISVVIDGSSLTFQEHDRMERANYSVNKALKPKTIDLLPDNASSEVKLKGLYELDGDSLKLVYTLKGARPTDFGIDAKQSEDVARTTLLILKRKK